MTIEQLRNTYRATPFRPFTIRLADGRAYEVPHREFISFSPTGRTIIVHQLDDTYGVIDLLLVTDLVVHAPMSTNGPPS